MAPAGMKFGIQSREVLRLTLDGSDVTCSTINSMTPGLLLAWDLMLSWRGVAHSQTVGGRLEKVLSKDIWALNLKIKALDF